MFKALSENKLVKKSILIFFSTLKGVLVYVIGLCSVALLMNLLKKDSSVLYYSLYVFIMLGSFVCAIASCKKLNGRGFLIGLLSAVPYSLFVFILTLVLSEFNISPNIIMVFFLSFLGGFLGGITAVNTRL